MVKRAANYVKDHIISSLHNLKKQSRRSLFLVSFNSLLIDKESGTGLIVTRGTDSVKQQVIAVWFIRSN